MARKNFDVNRSWTKLILSAIVLDALILMAFVTSTPSQSPATTWMAAAYKVRFKIAPVTDKAQLAAMHAKSGSMSKQECEACHGDMLDSTVALHRIHLTSQLLPGLVCHDCHKSINLQSRGNTVVVKWVDEGFCKQCHSQFPGLSPNSPMKPSDFNADCTTCHSGNHAFRHDRPYLSQIIAPRECKGCHGGRVLPWTPLHEQANWLQAHGPEALRVGTKSCLQCHDYGLKFCDTCHAIRPPSHTPRDQWLLDHPAKAQADTRVCFSCHKPDFCKKCHINHEANWLANHPTFVQANGTTSCQKCHSLTFCSYCHANNAMGGSQPTSPTP